MPYLELPAFRMTVFYIINGSIPSILLEDAPEPVSGELDPELPNLFWVHGSTSSLAAFEPQWSCTKFRRGYNMISVDAPFMGRSKAEERETWTVQENAEVLVSVIEHLGLATFSVVGEGYLGAYAAALMTIKYPEKPGYCSIKVKAVVMVSPCWMEEDPAVFEGMMTEWLPGASANKELGSGRVAASNSPVFCVLIVTTFSGTGVPEPGPSSSTPEPESKPEGRQAALLSKAATTLVASQHLISTQYSTRMKIILTGATGNTGSHALARLISLPAVTSIVVLTRRALKLPPDSPKVSTLLLTEEEFLDYPPRVTEAVSGASGAVWALGKLPTQTPEGLREAERIGVGYPTALMRAVVSNPPLANGEPFRLAFTSGGLIPEDPNASLWFAAPLRKLGVRSLSASQPSPSKAVPDAARFGRWQRSKAFTPSPPPMHQNWTSSSASPGSSVPLRSDICPFLLSFQPFKFRLMF
ncbi:hypothetical protein P7C70_g5679, partial [Phenoliferia sp. Uapishka_3]